jgi:hypothetical protein
MLVGGKSLAEKDWKNWPKDLPVSDLGARSIGLKEVGNGDPDGNLTFFLGRQAPHHSRC